MGSRFAVSASPQTFFSPTSAPPSFKGRVGWGWCLVWLFGVVAITDSRPCVVCRPSMAASYFLLLAQKKVTKENGTLGFAPSRYGEGSLRADGFRPTGHPWPVVRIGAIPRAARVRCTRLFRPPSAAAQREPEEKSEKKERNRRALPVSDISGASAAGTAALCSSGFPLGRGEQAQEIAACPARGRAQDARASDLGTGMCRERTPEPARVVCRAWMPGDRGREGAFFFGYFLLDEQEKVTRPPGWRTNRTRT